MRCTVKLHGGGSNPCYHRCFINADEFLLANLCENLPYGEWIL